MTAVSCHSTVCYKMFAFFFCKLYSTVSLQYDFSLQEGIIFIRPSIYILISVIFSAIQVVNLSSCIIPLFMIYIYINIYTYTHKVEYWFFYFNSISWVLRHHYRTIFYYALKIANWYMQSDLYKCLTFTVWKSCKIIISTKCHGAQCEFIF